MAKGHAKAHFVRVRVTPDLLKQIESKAKAQKLTISEWLRNMLNDAVLKVGQC